MKISTQFYLSFWIIALFFIIVIAIAMFQVHRLYKLTNEFNDYAEITNQVGGSVVIHKKAVPDTNVDTVIRKKNVVHDAHLNIVKMLNQIKEIAILNGTEDLEMAKKAIFALEADIEKSFETIEKHFSGNKQKLDHAKQLFEQWKSIRNQVIILQIKGRRDDALKFMFKGEGAQHIVQLEHALEKLHHFMDEEVDHFLTQARLEAINSLWLAVAMVSVLLVGGWLVFILSRHLAKNMTFALKIANAFASGQLTDQINCDANTNTGQFLKTLDTMHAQLVKSDNQVEKLAADLQKLEKEKRIVEKEKRAIEEEKRLAEKALRTKKAFNKAFSGSFLEGDKEVGDEAFDSSGDVDIFDDSWIP